jgi:hypothetical protein
MEATITEMDHLADDLRKVSVQHGQGCRRCRWSIRAHGSHDYGLHQDGSYSRQETVTKTLRNALTEESPPREV